MVVNCAQAMTRLNEALNLNDIVQDTGYIPYKIFLSKTKSWVVRFQIYHNVDLRQFYQRLSNNVCV